MNNLIIETEAYKEAKRGFICFIKICFTFVAFSLKAF